MALKTAPPPAPFIRLDVVTDSTIDTPCGSHTEWRQAGQAVINALSVDSYFADKVSSWSITSGKYEDLRTTAVFCGAKAYHTTLHVDSVTALIRNALETYAPHIKEP